MQRLVLTPEQQAFVDTWKIEHAAQLDPIVFAGSNLVVDDHLQIDNSWCVVVLGGQDGAVQSYIPEWDLQFNIDLVDFVTDRAGPNGQTMPIYDPQEQQARAAKVDPQNPKQAAKVERREERAHRRDLKEAVREAVKRLPNKERKHAREVLRSKGVLGKDDHDGDDK